MLLPPDTPQGIADALGYLQHHLYELTERQNVSKNNINTTLAALTAQLQQLMQLVANPPSAYIKRPSSACTIPSSVSAPHSDSKTNASQALLPSRLRRRTSQRPCISKLLLPVHLPGPGDGDQREFDLETRVTTNGNMIISEMFHSCALNK